MLQARLVCVLIVLGVLLPGAGAFAQERTGTITGTVSDAGRYVLPGARIELTAKGPTVVSDQQRGVRLLSGQPAGPDSARLLQSHRVDRDSTDEMSGSFL